MEGQELEADHDFAAAASAYARVLPSSPVYGEAQLKAGTCLYRQAAALEEDRKSDEAAAARAAARPLLEKAREMLDRQLAQTLEAGARARLADLAFTARATSASLLLQEGGARVAEVLPILADVESTFAGDEDKISTAWSLRIRALELEGKLDEAVEMLDALASKSPDARTLGPAAGSLARALDRASIELHDQDPASPRGQQLARQAARLYGLSVRGQLAGRESPDVRTLEAVGTRLLTLAMSFEGAPEEASSFLDWRPAVQSAPEVWDQAIRVFQALVSAGATYRAEIMLGRIQGLLGNWTEASTTYLRLFEREHLVDPSGRRFDATLIRSEPELVEAWVEWCMAEVEVGRSQQDNSHFTRAADLIDKALANLEKDSRLWWNAKCLQIETLLLRGQYEGADIAMRDVERTTHDFDQGKYGAKPRLLDLKAQIQKKVGGR
jgi:tetratricopeptide (TPR) repeat protein